MTYSGYRCLSSQVLTCKQAATCGSVRDMIYFKLFLLGMFVNIAMGIISRALRCRGP